MRSYNVLLLITLVLVSFSNAFEFTNLAEVKELRTTHYGNSLIETISLSLQNSGSVADISKLLDDLLYKLNKDQEDSDSAWAKASKELQDKIDTLTSDITNLETQIALDEKEQAEKEGKRDEAIANLVQFNDQKDKNDKAITKNEENRQKDIAEHKASIQDHNDVINAIGQVVSELEKLKGSVSGVNKPTHVDEIAAETRDRLALGNAFVQLTRDQNEAMIFAQMATSADQDALVKLINLLKDLSESTKRSLNDDEAKETSSLANYQTLKGLLTEDNVKLGTAITDQNTNLTTYKERIAALITKIGDQKALKTSKETEKADNIKLKADKETQYNSEKSQRAEEKAVIQKLQAIVAERLANMSKFLSSKVGA